ncbi:hypothetical protein ACU4GD_23200 [Cupriavidus basilensis]
MFHTAAFFRDNHKGGSHWETLRRINVDGTAALIGQAYACWCPALRADLVHCRAQRRAGRGDRRDQRRDPAEADDYYRSKILADRAVQAFLEATPDMHATFVLPGWMWGRAISAARLPPAKWRSTRCWPSCRAWFRGVFRGRCPRCRAGADRRRAARPAWRAASRGGPAYDDALS